MADSYKRIYLHLILVVKNREALITKNFNERLFGFIHEAINSRGNYCYKVGGHLDHVHIFFDYKGKELLSDMIREIKKSSNIFINTQRLTKFHFQWQKGYGLFSVGSSSKQTVINYINNQEAHHNNGNTFKDEYLQLLNEFDVKYNQDYLFDFIKF